MAVPVAVVTGGNRGLGLETGRQLGRRGYRVVLASRREAEGALAAGALVREGLDVAAWPLDVADPGGIEAFARRARGEGLALEALVNNAGVYPSGSTRGRRGSRWRSTPSARCASRRRSRRSSPRGRGW